MLYADVKLNLFSFLSFFRVPELFNYIAKNSQEDIFYEDDIWPGEDENG